SLGCRETIVFRLKPLRQWQAKERELRTPHSPSKLRALALKELEEQPAHLLGLLLLHPVAGSIQQVEPHHMRAGSRLHLIHGSRRLINTPVALACDVLGGHVD